MREEQTGIYMEFVENFRMGVCRYLEGRDCEVSFQPAHDEDGEDYMVVKWRGKKGSNQQRFHMKKIFLDYEKEEYSMEEIMGTVEEIINCCKEAGENCCWDQIEDYDEICNRLIIRLLNYDSNYEKLKKGIYEKVGDIAIVLYIHLGTIEGNYISCMVPDVVFSSWRKCKKDVMQAAMENTYELFPPRIYNMLALFNAVEEVFCSFMDKEDLPVDGDGPCGVFITNTNQINGAVALFLPGVAKKLGELMEGDYYIGFTSIHEAAIHKIDTVRAELIRKTLTELHRDAVESDDFLSEKVYRYNRERDRIELVGD
ncbi:MAG: DUF5688 family protein [Clostridiales bacterium]|nr:DUF5688 family protein [Clostridiales bacterium]